MKAISPMLAVILLIAFTVAVGGILSLWFASLTKTQTTSTSTAAACSANTIDVSVPVYTSTSVTVRYVNRGPNVVNITSITVTCGGSPQVVTSGLDTNLGVGYAGTKTVSGLSGCTSSNIEVTLVAACVGGGTVTSGCPAGTCV